MSGEIKLFARKAGDGGMIARGRSGHWTLMDAGKDAGAITPFEMLFSALAGCAGYDVMLVLRKKRVDYDDLWINIEADRTDDYPRVATRIHMHFTVVGDNIPPETIERAIALSQEKYCSVSAMISKSTPVETSFEIIDKTEAQGRNPMGFFA